MMTLVLGSLYSIGFWLVAFGCWVASILGLPGLWGMVVLAAINAWLVPEDLMVHTSWWNVGMLAFLAVLGEGIEFAAGAAGVGKLNGSRQAAILSVVGSLIGAIVGLFLAIPIPIPLVGPMLGSLLMSGVGAMVGAWVGERWMGRDQSTSLKIGLAAFAGRLVGTLGKSVCGAAMLALFTVGVFSHWL